MTEYIILQFYLDMIGGGMLVGLVFRFFRSFIR